MAKNEKKKNPNKSSNVNSSSSSSGSGSLSSADSDIFSLSEDSFFSNLSDIDELRHSTGSANVGFDSDKFIDMLSVSESVLTTYDLNELFKIIMLKAISLTDAESGYLLLVDKKRKKVDTSISAINADDLIIAHSENIDIEGSEEAYKQISKTVVNKVIETKKVEIIKNALDDENLENQQSIINLKLKSIMCAPMIVKNEIIGVIYVENRLIPKIFTKETGKILQFFGNQCAIAIENGNLFEEYNNLFTNLNELVEKQTQELTREKQYNEDLIQNIGEILFVVDKDFKIVKTNKALSKILGLDSKDFLNKKIDSLYSKKTIKIVTKSIKQRNYVSNIKCSIKNSENNYINFSATFTPMKDRNDKFAGTIIVNSNMTEYEKLEKERSERLQLEAITKATVTANDQINTPLGVIIGRAKIIEALYKDDEKISKNLDIIKEQSFRIKNTLDKMKKMTKLKFKDYKLTDVTMLDLTEDDE